MLFEIEHDWDFKQLIICVIWCLLIIVQLMVSIPMSNIPYYKIVKKNIIPT